MLAWAAACDSSVADPDAQTGAFDAAELVDGSLAADAAILDSASADGALVDAMRIDAMTADAMTADTMSVDTMSVDAITPDAMIPDAMPPDATPSPTFVYVSTLMTWSAAESHCLATFGAHLATIHSSADNTLAVTAASGQLVWLGGSDVALEGTWAWASGELWDYQAWASGFPSGAVNDCLILRPDGAWQDAACTLTAPFVCRVP